MYDFDRNDNRGSIKDCHSALRSYNGVLTKIASLKLYGEPLVITSSGTNSLLIFLTEFKMADDTPPYFDVHMELVI